MFTPTIKRVVFTSFAAALLISTSACVEEVQRPAPPAHTVYVQSPPPADIVEVQPPPPNENPNWEWQKGHWRWNGTRYYWVHGHWAPRPPNYTHWVAPHWENRGGEFFFVEGHWQ